MKKIILAAAIYFLTQLTATAQDPGFSQFFASPMSMNPTLTGMTKADWRVMAHGRDQWLGVGTPFRTATVAFDTKMLQDKLGDNSTFGIGVMMMTDQAMQGAVKSSYGAINTSYHINLVEGEVTQALGMGVGVSYGNRRVDFARLKFEDQYNGYGFNLPTSETAVSQMKPYISGSAGLTYTYTTENTNIDLGVATYHLNKPKRSYLDDESQNISRRYVVHANIETYLKEWLVFNGNAVYQNQYGIGYYCIGGSLGYLLTYDNADGVALNTGLWYWSKYALIPYIGMTYKNFQVGLSYDVVLNKLAQSSIKPKTFELSITLRGLTDGLAIPTPWK